MSSKQVTEPKLRFKTGATTIELWVLDIGQWAKLADHRSFHFQADKSASLIYVTKGPGGYHATEEHIDDANTWAWIQEHMSNGIALAEKKPDPAVPDMDSIAMNPSGDLRDQAKSVHWFQVEILNCKLAPNDSRPRRQIHKIGASTTEEARRLAPTILNHLFGSDTYVGDVNLWV